MGRLEIRVMLKEAIEFLKTVESCFFVDAEIVEVNKEKYLVFAVRARQPLDEEEWNKLLLTIEHFATRESKVIDVEELCL